MTPIIIPSCTPDNLRACLHALKENNESERPVCIVTNAEDISPIYYVADESTFPNITLTDYGNQRFNFSRAINLGLDFFKPLNEGVILLNDDAELLTNYGFTQLEVVPDAYGGLAIASAMVKGLAAGASQHFRHTELSVIQEPYFLAFICVYLPPEVLKTVGWLCEDFTGYGQEDVEYCLRAKDKNITLVTVPNVLVRHDGTLPSTYRTRDDLEELAKESKDITERKGIVIPWK